MTKLLSDKKLSQDENLNKQQILFSGLQIFIFITLCITISKLPFCNRDKNVSKQNENEVVKTLKKSVYLSLERIGKMFKT